jgi:hypothetical protein
LSALASRFPKSGNTATKKFVKKYKRGSKKKPTLSADLPIENVTKKLIENETKSSD